MCIRYTETIFPNQFKKKKIINNVKICQREQTQLVQGPTID